MTVDNFFTSLQCARELKCRNLTMIGTVRKNLRDVPHVVRKVHGRPHFSTDFRFNAEDDILLMYAAKRNKAVLLMSTMHKNTAVHNNEKKKLLAIEF